LAGTPPHNPLGELTALPQTPCWILGGPTSKGKVVGEKGRARKERGRVKGEVRKKRPRWERGE